MPSWAYPRTRPEVVSTIGLLIAFLPRAGNLRAARPRWNPLGAKRSPGRTPNSRGRVGRCEFRRREIRPFDLLDAIGEFRSSTGQSDGAVVEKVGTIGHLECVAHVLFNEQDRSPAVCRRANGKQQPL